MLTKQKKNTFFQRYIIGEAIFQGPEVFGFILENFGPRSLMAAAVKAEDDAKIEEAKKAILEGKEGYYKDYNAEIDENLLASMLDMVYNGIDKEFHPAMLGTIHDKYKGDFKKFAAKYFEKCMYKSMEDLKAGMEKFSAKSYDKDPLITMMNEVVQVYVQQILIPQSQSEEKMERGMRLFVDGYLLMNQDKSIASDANSTMRVTYGNVLSL